MHSLVTFKRTSYLHFDPDSQTVTLEIEDSQLSDVKVKLSGELARALGFDPDTLQRTGSVSRLANCKFKQH